MEEEIKEYVEKMVKETINSNDLKKYITIDGDRVIIDFRIKHDYNYCELKDILISEYLKNK